MSGNMSGNMKNAGFKLFPCSPRCSRVKVHRRRCQKLSPDGAIRNAFQPGLRWLIWLLLACATSVPSSAESSLENQSGHQRILELLQRVKEQGRIDNPYVGQGQLQGLQAELDRLPAGESSSRRWALHMQLGRHLLQLGREAEGLNHYEKAFQQIQAGGDRVPSHLLLENLFRLGVAHMRVGETQNCVQRHNTESCILPIRGKGVHVNQEPSRKAVHYFTEVLKRAQAGSDEQIRAKWLLNIVYMTLGLYPDGVPADFRIPMEIFASDEEFPRFVDIAPKLGLSAFDLAGGAIGEDFDGDGFLDIMVSTFDPSGQMHFYRNNGDGSFSERTEKANLTGLLGGLNMMPADYDNDGDTDVLVLRGGWFEKGGQHPNSLLRNNSDGTFTDVAFEAGLGKVHYPTQTGAWADYDNDGDLDLYLGNETTKSFRAPCQLFRNNGDGTFTDVAIQAGVENYRWSKGVIWGDYDNDRFPDLYVANISGENRLYHNNGDGTFTDVAKQLGVTRPFRCIPTWFWDYDNDGALDLFVGAYGGPLVKSDMVLAVEEYLGVRTRAELSALYRGDGQGGFTHVSVEQNLHRVMLSMGSNFGDLDNDGFLDFYMGTGHPYYEALVPNLMYRNRGGKGFADITTSGGFGHLQKGHAIVFADLDNDGDQDIFEQMGGFFPGDAFRNALFENPGFPNHWIKIKLIGVRSNRSGFGARIRIELTEDGEGRTIYKHVNSGGGFGGNPSRQEIGLGRAQEMKRLEIFWPASNLTQTFHDIRADQLIEITEGQPEYRKLPLKKFSFAAP